MRRIDKSDIEEIAHRLGGVALAGACLLVRADGRARHAGGSGHRHLRGHRRHDRQRRADARHHALRPLSITGNGNGNGNGNGIGAGIGAGGALVLAMIPALAFGEQDPMKYMAALGLVGVAFATLVLSTWTLNAINLYSTSLVASTALRGASHGRIVIGCGIVGTALALVGIADRLIDFLVLLGVIVPPIAAVYLADFFVLGRRDLAPATMSSRTNANGLAACGAGAGLGLWVDWAQRSFTGVPTIESFVCAALVYLGAEAVRGAPGRDRLWRRAVGVGR